MSASTRIVVVGGGIVAASVAYHLARQGTSVVTVEADLPGPATAAGAGIICPWTVMGDDAHFRLCAEGTRYYPELLAMLAEDGQTDTGYAKVGALCVGQQTDRLAAIADVLRARQASWPEIGEVTVVGEGEPRRQFPPLAAELSGVWVSGGARIDGRLIRDCLLHGAAEYGALRMSGTAALELSGERVIGVSVEQELVTADAVVVAAGAWTAQVCAGAGWRLPIGPQRGQIVHTRLPAADTAGWPVILPPHDPYLLGFPDGRVVFGATREDAGFDYRVTLGGVRAMLTAAAEIAPGLSDATLLETRVGFRPATSDGRPLLGRLADGLIVAAGNGPEGLTAGPWTGLAAAALALGQQPAADIDAFDPARFQRAATGPA
jgi:D-amino-acid dehydrogenase